MQSNLGYYFLIFYFCVSGCGIDATNKRIETGDFFNQLKKENLPCDLLPFESDGDLVKDIFGASPIGLYKGKDFVFSLYDIPKDRPIENLDKNQSISVTRNLNLIMLGKGSNKDAYINVLKGTQPAMSLKQVGFFIYPLALCCLIAIFVTTERAYSLRSGLTFPRKVAKALQSGEFPDNNWGKKSSAERVVWLATKENASIDTVRSYARLEITSMERGLFLLELVVSAAPLLGLLGTVTGLVRVFSQIPAGGGVGDTAVFSEGIAMALLTTILGLAIAIPTLISHSYLTRVIETRATSLDWLTEKLADSIFDQRTRNSDELLS